MLRLELKYSENSNVITRYGNQIVVQSEQHHEGKKQTEC